MTSETLGMHMKAVKQPVRDRCALWQLMNVRM